MGNVTREFVFTLVRVKGNTINNTWSTSPRRSVRKGNLPLEDPLEMKVRGSEVPVGVGGYSGYTHGLTLELLDVTLFGKRAFADIIKLRILR